MSLTGRTMGPMRQATFEYEVPQPAAGPLQQVISGGEAGVDRAALDAARARGFKAGCPGRGRRALSVRDADATLIVYSGAHDKGTRETHEMALRLGKPVMAVDLADRASFDQARAWLARTSPRVLHVAGARESRSVGLYARSFAMLVRLLGPRPQSSRA
jgi:hypothetical protein